ncbi:MAG: 4Fe-4S dicluster domain-containing protein [Thermoleophilia bacterium]
MIPVSRTVPEGAHLAAEIERRSGMRVSDCNQCGRCTSTCAGAIAFDIPPHQMMRYLQLGLTDRVLDSATAQLCFDCMTCSLRCPMQIDVAVVIETTKNIADEQGRDGGQRGIGVFRREFLRNVRRHGRLHEPSLLAWINLKTYRPFNDLSLVPVLGKKKLHVVPPRIRNLRSLRRMFRRVSDTFNSGAARTSPKKKDTV